MIDLFALFIISLCSTYILIPYTITKLIDNNYLARDRYKPGNVLLPTNTGIILFFISLTTITISPLLSRIINIFYTIDNPYHDFNTISLAMLLVVSVYTIYGLVDDLIDISRKFKIFIPILFSIPLANVIHPEQIWLPVYGTYNLDTVLIYDFTRNDLFRFMLVPIYVMVVSNLINMHSGYNGLQSGLTLILMATIIIESSLDGKLRNIYPVVPIFGSLVAFWIFNKYPAKIFEGNIGSFFYGSTLGAAIVIQNYWWFGVFILVPHIINFILWIVFVYMIHTKPEAYLSKDGSHKKFGKIDEKGNIQVPNRLVLKWIPNYYFNLNEKDSVIVMHLFTLIFCLIGIFLF